MMTKKGECLSSPTHLPSIYEGQPITSKVAWKAWEKAEKLKWPVSGDLGGFINAQNK